MRKWLMVGAALAVLGAGQAQAVEKGDWIVRLRGIGVIPQESADISVIGGDVSIGSQVVPELDFSYFFTRNIAAELILATTPHDVTAKGTSLGDVDLGDVWLLPPTLTVQYHFDGLGQWKPYVGAGVNYTHFYNEDSGAATDISYDDSFGPALQAGVDIALNDRWMVNLDVKKVWINTNASINGGAIEADVDIDPWLIGVGIGYRF